MAVSISFGSNMSIRSGESAKANSRREAEMVTASLVRKEMRVETRTLKDLAAPGLSQRPRKLLPRCPDRLSHSLEQHVPINFHGTSRMTILREGRVAATGLLCVT
jgi:hypothetical protein